MDFLYPLNGSIGSITVCVGAMYVKSFCIMNRFALKRKARLGDVEMNSMQHDRMC